MKVESIPRSTGTDVVTTRPDATMATVISLHKRQGIGALVVTEDGRHVPGPISQKDVISGRAENGARLLHLTVADLTSDSPEERNALSWLARVLAAHDPPAADVPRGFYLNIQV